MISSSWHLPPFSPGPRKVFEKKSLKVRVQFQNRKLKGMYASCLHQLVCVGVEKNNVLRFEKHWKHFRSLFIWAETKQVLERDRLRSKILLSTTTYGQLVVSRSAQRATVSCGMRAQGIVAFHVRECVCSWRCRGRGPAVESTVAAP